MVVVCAGTNDQQRIVNGRQVAICVAHFNVHIGNKVLLILLLDDQREMIVTILGYSEHGWAHFLCTRDMRRQYE